MYKFTEEEIQKFREDTGCSVFEATRILFLEELLEETRKANDIESIKNVLIELIREIELNYETRG